MAMEKQTLISWTMSVLLIVTYFLFMTPCAHSARCGSEYTFILIADSDGSEGLSLELNPYCCGLYDARGIWPAVDTSGEVAFRSGLDTGGFGLFSGDGVHAVRTLVLDQAADSGSDFLSISNAPAIATVNNSWHGVAFFATKTTATFSADGIFRARFGFPTTTIALNEESSSLGVLNQQPSIRSDGSVVFTASLSLVPGNPKAIVSSLGSSPQILFDSQTAGIPFFDHPVANRTDVAMTGEPDIYPGPTGIYRYRDGSIREQRPPIEDFQPFKPAISDNSIGTGGFIAAMINDPPGGERRLYRFGEQSGLGTELADSSGGPNTGYHLYETAAVDGNGCVAFVAYNRVTYRRGIYVADENGITKVLEIGEPLFGRWVNNMEMYKFAMNSRGQIAFWAELGDFPYQRVIVRADPMTRPCLADLDGSGDVSGTDLSDFTAAFGSQQNDPNYDPDADFNDSGAVDLEDLSGFALQFGHTGTNCGS